MLTWTRTYNYSSDVRHAIAPVKCNIRLNLHAKTNIQPQIFPHSQHGLTLLRQAPVRYDSDHQVITITVTCVQLIMLIWLMSKVKVIGDIYYNI